MFKDKSLLAGQVFAFVMLVGAGLVAITLGLFELISWLIRVY